MIGFDCHAHIYEKVASVPGARYVPSTPAPLENWLTHLRHHRIKGGVIVQISFLGTDNTELCAALAKLDRKCFAGVAVVDLDVTDQALANLVNVGVRGIRWNLVRGKGIPDLSSQAVQGFLRRLHRHDLHLEIHLEGPRLAPILAPLTDQGVRIVVDHFGLPSDPDPNCDPLVMATNSLTDASSLYFKFSAHYRSQFDVTGNAHVLLSKLDDGHIVWGSDWPHTQHEDENAFSIARSLCDDWGLKSDSAAARDLYRIELEV